MWKVITLYGLLMLLVVVYLAILQVEHFETIREATPQNATEATCFQCMTYYQDVFSIKNPDDMLEYLRKRNVYIQSAIDAFQRFIDSSIKDCSKNGSEPTVTEVVTCFGNYVNAFLQKCQETSSFMECAVARNLADIIYKKALMCGTQACSLKDFKAKFATGVKAMNDEFYQCKMSFQKQDDACVILYRNIMETKRGKPQDAAAVQADATPITQAMLNEKLGDMATFAMNMT